MTVRKDTAGGKVGDDQSESLPGCMKTPAAVKGGQAGTNKGKTAIKEGKFDLFLMEQTGIKKQNIKMKYSSVQRGRRRQNQNEPYKV
jgi:hypothetical protein